MQMRQMRNDTDNAQKCADMRIDLHRCSSAKYGAWPSLIETVSHLQATIQAARPG